MISDELRALAVTLAALPGEKIENVMEVVGIVRKNLFALAKEAQSLEEHLLVPGPEDAPDTGGKA
jgi:hypothetical protein